jgi:hypothetical protein
MKIILSKSADGRARVSVECGSSQSERKEICKRGLERLVREAVKIEPEHLLPPEGANDPEEKTEKPVPELAAPDENGGEVRTKSRVVQSWGDPEGIKRLEEYQAMLDRGEGRPVPKSMLKRMEDPIGFDHTGRAFTEEDTRRNYERMFGKRK